VMTSASPCGSNKYSRNSESARARLTKMFVK
jgi:hypothetical protein